MKIDETKGKELKEDFEKMMEEKPFSPEEARASLKKARHSADTALTVLSALLTVAFLAYISWLAVTARDNEDAMKLLVEYTGMEKELVQGILRFGGDIVLAVMLYLLALITEQNITFLGKMLSGEMRLSDSRFAEVKEFYRLRAEACGMKHIPELFITGTNYDSNVLKVPVRSNKAIAIDKKMILKAEQTGDWSDVEYTVSKRLARIYLGYYDLPNQMFTFLAKLIPGFRELLSRCRTYSTDKVVMALIGDEKAIENVFRECYDVELYKDLDREEIVKRKLVHHTKSEYIGEFLENFTSDTPVSPYRLFAMIDKDSNGKLF